MDQISKQDLRDALSPLAQDMRATQIGVASLEQHFNTVNKTLGDQTKRFDQIDKTLSSIGDHLITVENRLEKLTDIQRIDEKVERMRTALREKFGVEV